MMQYTSQELVTFTLKDCFKYRNKIAMLFTVLSLIILLIGSQWPKHYKAEALIYVDNRNIIEPLMQGTAITAESKDIARNAKEIILGSNILGLVLESSGWIEAGLSPIEAEEITNIIKSKTHINKVGDSLIRIEFTDKDPRKAYLTVKGMSEQYVDIGKINKVEESRSAYEFIEKQASDYLHKLTSVDKEIKEFVTENPDARPGTQEKVTQRVTALQRKLEDTSLALREAKIKMNSIHKQLSGEAAVTISQSREGKYRNKITDMENQLETLLLTYTETYPDVVRLRRQIEDVKRNLEDEMKLRDEAIMNARNKGKMYLDSSIATNPIYQELRSGLSSTETQIATLESRLKELKELLRVEFDRIRRIEEGDSMMQSLTRDYKVNQEIYQDLLKRRENARISRSLDTQEKGSTFTILEAAKLPLTPFGIRFLHFAILGIFIGIITPVGIIVFLLQIDGKVRSGRHIMDEMGVPVLAEIPHYWKDNEKAALKRNYKLLMILISFVIAVYIVVSVLKFAGII